VPTPPPAAASVPAPAQASQLETAPRPPNSYAEAVERANNTDPGAGGQLTAAHLVEPAIEVTTDGGTTYSDWQVIRVLHTKGTPGTYWYPDILRRQTVA
jgi:hypothetical protein